MKQTLKQTLSELEGFEVFQPTPKGLLMTTELKVQGSIVQLTYGSVRALGYPNYVNFFFDRNTQRVMVKRAADEKTPNTLKLKSNDVKKKQADMGVIPCSELAKAIRQLAGIRTEDTVYFAGHIPGKAQETLIFHLTESRSIEKKTKEKKADE